MTSDHERPQSLLWVGKAPVNDGGDEILDRKLVTALGRAYAVTRFDIATQSRLNQIRGLLRGMPQPRYKYANPAIERAVVRAATGYDHVVISLETLEHLGPLLPCPVTLIIHNVTHDVLSQLYGTSLVGRMAAAQSLRWERRLYPRDNIRLVTLSRRDQALVQAMAPAKPIAVACPGSPPLTPLAGQGIIPELVLSGSYDWRPKQRDLIALAEEYAALGRTLAWRHDRALPTHPGATPIASASRLIEAADYTQGIRFGVIPDRFLGGFKLKSTYFVASNCILLSRCDIRSEFDGLPFAERFIRYTPQVADIIAVMNEFAACDPATLHNQWQEFRDACARQFSWERAAHAISRHL